MSLDFTFDWTHDFENEVIPCKYSRFGCSIVLQRSLLKKHYKQSSKYHLSKNFGSHKHTNFFG